jgi:radical SAM-linked protein
VSFTGGFHPLSRVQFALALPLGAEADGEWMDIEFTRGLDPAEALQQLQPQLPEGFALLQVESVEVSGASLSQELVAARWQLRLRPVAAPSQAVAVPPLAAWRAAAAELLASESWIWHDTDKKGRPRQRDCRPFLESLAVDGQPEAPSSVLVHYGAVVDPAGRSLRPEQLQHWFAQYLNADLEMVSLRRESLQLRQSSER